MTRQTWTAAVSAFCFLWCALVVTVAPAPFVAYSPGSTYDLLGSSDGSTTGGSATHPLSARRVMSDRVRAVRMRKP